jgi:nucleotide-binding universal stress UspA family protein
MSTEQLSPVGRFSRILLATDGSEFAAGAVREAIAMARKCGATLVVLSVVRSNDEYEALAPKLVEKEEAAARATLEAVATEARGAGVACEALVRHGEQPYQSIVDAAEEQNADAIVLGRRGRSGIMRLLMGSTVSKVIGHARCPVFVVPRAAQVVGRPIVLGSDGSRFSDAAAVAAGRLAKMCDVPLTVVSVADGKEAPEALSIAQRVCDSLVAEGVRCQSVVPEGRPEEALPQVAGAQQAGLIVVGSHGRHGTERFLLGSVAERVIGHATGAVLVVK